MALHTARTGHDEQGDLIEGFHQPPGGGPGRPACGMASQQFCDLLALLRQSRPAEQ